VLEPPTNKWLSWKPLRFWDELPDCAGVYEIWNRTAGLFYVGSAVSLKRRGHYNLLQSGKSHNLRLQQDFNKHGEESFFFRVLDFCRDEELICVEQRRIDERQFETLYNVAPIAGNTLGYRFTQEQIERVRKARVGVPVRPDVKQSNWAKKVEREAKERIYIRLLRRTKRTHFYRRLVDQVWEQLRKGPGFGSSVVVYLGDTRKELDCGVGFQSWWQLGGGMNYADSLYHFTNYSWKHITALPLGC
jgi:group I intron endonuclease